MADYLYFSSGMRITLWLLFGAGWWKFVLDHDAGGASSRNRNAELLHATGYEPRVGVFTVSDDNTSAAFAFGTKTLPNGTLIARISAFDKPAGACGANEAVAMPARRENLMNNPLPAPASIPPASLMPVVIINFIDLPFVDLWPLMDMVVLSDADFDTLLNNQWTRVQSVLLTYVPANVKFDPVSMSNGTFLMHSACVGNGGRTVAGDQRAAHQRREQQAASGYAEEDFPIRIDTSPVAVAR